MKNITLSAGAEHSTLHAEGGYIVGLEEAEMEGLDVLVVDDVCTTGGSTVKAIERAREAGMNITGVICLVDREQGGRDAIEGALGCPFDSVFTVGELLEE